MLRNHIYFNLVKYLINLSKIKYHQEFKHCQSSEKTLNKINNHLTNEITKFIQESPFAVLYAADSEGNFDASPRGWKLGFIKIIDSKTLLIPDIQGNRLLQTYLQTQKLFFFIPGNNKYVRLNSRVRFLELKE